MIFVMIIIAVIILIVVMIRQLEREVEELEAAGMAAEAEDQRMRELCGEYSGQF